MPELTPEKRAELRTKAMKAVAANAENAGLFGNDRYLRQLAIAADENLRAACPGETVLSLLDALDAKERELSRAVTREQAIAVLADREHLEEGARLLLLAGNGSAGDGWEQDFDAWESEERVRLERKGGG